MRKLLLLVISMTLSFSLTFGQRNFVNGYVVQSPGDTLKGLLDFREWKLNPAHVTFMAARGATEKVYDLTSCIGFGIYEPAESYEKHVVTREISYQDPIDLTVQHIGEYKTDTVFLRVIYRGSKYNLYLYHQMKDHFFISHDDKMEELLLVYNKDHFRTSTTGDILSQPVTQKLYKNQLKQFYNWLTDKKLTKTIERSEYNEYDLLRIVTWLDKGQQPGTVKGPKSNSLVLSAGVNVSRLSIKGLVYTGTPSFQQRNVKLDPAPNPTIAAGIQFNDNRRLQRVFIRVLLQYSQFSGKGEMLQNWQGESDIEKYRVKQSLLACKIGTGYKFNLGAGFTVIPQGFVAVARQKTISQSIDVYDKTSGLHQYSGDQVYYNRKTMFFAEAGMGINWKKRWELNGLYLLPTKADDNSAYNVTLSGLLLSVNYFIPLGR